MHELPSSSVDSAQYASPLVIDHSARAQILKPAALVLLSEWYATVVVPNTAIDVGNALACEVPPQYFVPPLFQPSTCT
jgi:hypothetical protein